MQTRIDTLETNDLVANAAGSSCVVLVCEHASHHIPKSFGALGLSQEDSKCHAAWDLGAKAVAKQLSARLDAVLIASNVSRLVYDCNRPPDSPDAMPERSEIIDVPGNRNLTQSQRDARVSAYYRPFRSTLHSVLKQVANPVLVTVHSFTPIYHGQTRSTEIGILHDTDTRLADAMLQMAGTHTSANVQRNEPYGPKHGVTHTLKEHALKAGHPNVMLEIRNDLIATATQQEDMAATLAGWIEDAFTQLDVPGVVHCRA